jgi:hypothetical protein
MAGSGMAIVAEENIAQRQRRIWRRPAGGGIGIGVIVAAGVSAAKYENSIGANGGEKRKLKAERRDIGGVSGRRGGVKESNRSWRWRLATSKSWR